MFEIIGISQYASTRARAAPRGEDDRRSAAHPVAEA